MSIDELTSKAEQLEQEGMLEEAFTLLGIASQREPDPVILCEYASLAMKLEKWPEAEGALKTATVLAPDLPNPLTLLGILYYELGVLEVAASYFKQSLKLEETAAGLTLLASVQLELDLVDDAKPSLLRAIQIDPDYEEAYYNLGRAERTTDPAKAIQWFEKAIELDPEYSLAHRELGWILNAQGNNAEAEYHVTRALELNDTDAWAQIYEGNILWKRGDLVSAEKSFKNAIVLWPESAVPYWCLAQFYEYNGNLTDAEKFYQAGIDVDPDDAQANKLFGEYLIKIGEAEKGKKYLQKQE